LKVRYDVRGHGRSGKPEEDEGWEWERFAEDFDTVVEAFGVRRPFVAGWYVGVFLLE
jgi:pimeloyl-ACP methyl ester carboxylesterase